MPRLSRANALLADQHARLSAVIASTQAPEVRSLAEHYLAKVRHWQGRPEAARDLALGEMGPNQYGASIDSVCRDAEFFAQAAADVARAA